MSLMESSVNVPLLRKAVEWVEWQAALPEWEREWEQSEWFHKWDCGTRCCVAGKLALDDGWKPKWVKADHAWAAYVTKDGVSSAVEEVASNLLGITGRQAERLFNSGNEASDIRRIAEDLAGERL